MAREPIRVLVTGAAGNLGGKLVRHLSAASWCAHIVAIDRGRRPDWASEAIDWIAADLTAVAGETWPEVFASVDAVVHLATRVASPDASWEEAKDSLDMTCNVLNAARAKGVRRFVFASSNHVMGQYKDQPLADGLGVGGLKANLPVGPGTSWFDGTRHQNGVAYATAKFAGERLCASAAKMSGGHLTAVSLRIGWCQEGQNDPITINTSGVPGGQSASGPDAERDLRWFRNMWLSNRDFLDAVTASIKADAVSWPDSHLTLNAMSNNKGMPWDIMATRQAIGYTPLDDVWEHLA